MSTPDMPKQFIDVFDTGKSLIQHTIERFSGVIPDDNVWIITNERYCDIVREQIPNILPDHILLEPCMRNTAPCIAYVSWKIKARYPDANIVFSPSDHWVSNVAEFKRCINEALDFTATHDAILTLGVTPTRPETGYGYIKSTKSDKRIVKVESFKEKPDLTLAQKYLADGNYYWNSGLFIWNINTIVEQMTAYTPELAELFSSLSDIYYTDKEQSTINSEFAKCSVISIDYAVMEKSTKTFVMAVDFGWSDIGTWSSLRAHLPYDAEGNATVGENIGLVNSHNCMVRTMGCNKVVIEGLSDYIVVFENNNLLICKIADEQKIKGWHE